MFANVKGRVALIATLAVGLTGAAGLTGVAGAASAASTARAAGASRGPWNQVGPGWELADYSSATAGIPAKPGPATLYLVSPAGGRYALYRWWLVPVSGARPTALTPQRGISSGDYGDLDAWQLPGGLYLQVAGACGTLQIFRQSGNGSITRITPPHTTGNNNVIVTTSGSRMLVHVETGCPDSMSLLWYDPRTHPEQWVMKAPASQRGVVAVVPYYGRQNAPVY